jgi:hypothetical protein
MDLPKPMPAPEWSDRLAQLCAEESEWQRRAAEAQGRAAHAYARLLQIAESSGTGQANRVAQFVAATFNGSAFVFDPFDLRAVDVAISDDMLLCLDALRWAKADLYRLVPDGEARVVSIIVAWKLRTTANS